jgi:predicted molibdopterin-dependent oxidoreductase YjgC
MDSIKLQINDQEVEAEPSRTIMEAADRAGIYIPRLCTHPLLKPSGSCRLCAVELEGQRGLPAACSTPVTDGMKVWTKTPKVLDFRREMLRLILQDHPRECLGCPRNGTCELQRLVESVGIDFPYVPPFEERPPVETVGTCFERDMRLCVRCGRCVRVCHEVRGARAIIFRERAGHQEVSTPLGLTLEESGCQMCGACVDVCPVGALRERMDPPLGEAGERTSEVCENLTRMVMDLYRKESSRTWKQSICPICSANCRMTFELAESGRILQARPSPLGPGSHGQACVQGRFFLKSHLQRPDRLVSPLMRQNEGGSLAPADWETMIGHLAEKLQNYGAWETAVLMDAGLTTEELFLLQKFARTVLKTNLIGCLSPPGHAAMEEAFGRLPEANSFKGSLSDLSAAGCVLAIGVNPPATHPVAGTILRQAVLDGTKLVVMNPLSVGIGRYADIHLHHTPGTESTVLAGLAHLMLQEHGQASLPETGNGADREALRGNLGPYGPEEVARLTGVNVEQLVEAACVLRAHGPITILYGPGLAQSGDPRESMNAMTTLLRLTGSRSRAGGGLISLCGKGNERGAADLGLLSPLFETPTQWSSGSAPSTSRIGEVLASGQVKAVILVFDSLESNLFEQVSAYLERFDLVVLHDTVLPCLEGTLGKPTIHMALPMASALEKEGTFTTREGKSLSITPVRSAPGAARSSLWVIQELAQRMKAPGFTADSDEALRQDIWKQIAAATTLVRKTPKQASGCCCCGGAGSRATTTSDRDNGLSPWKPASIVSTAHFPSDEYPLQVVPKEALEPYFLGSLQARESQAVFFPGGEIEMSPVDAFRMELTPGDPVQLVTAGGSWEGILAQNRLLPPGMVAVPLRMLQSRLKDFGPEDRMVPGRVEKKA